MRIIGESAHKEYIAIITHDEIEMVMGKYYGKLGVLKIGDAVNIAAGYKFRDDIKAACEKMESAMKAFNEARTTMTKFAIMVGQLPEEL